MNFPNPFDTLKAMLIFPGQLVAQGATVEGPSSSTGIDLQLAGSPCGQGMVVISSKNGAATATTLSAKVTESATTNGAYTDVPGASITQIPATASLEKVSCIKFPLEGRLGFIRLSVTAGAGTNGPTLGAAVLLGGTSNVPVTQSVGGA